MYISRTDQGIGVARHQPQQRRSSRRPMPRTQVAPLLPEGEVDWGKGARRLPVTLPIPCAPPIQVAPDDRTLTKSFSKGLLTST